MALSRRALLAAVAGSTLAGCGPSAGGGAAAPAASVASASVSEAAEASEASAISAATPSEPPTPAPTTPTTPTAAPGRPEPTRAELVARYGGAEPKQWGMEVTGVITELPAGEIAMALTFDACGGPGGNGYDADLIDFLRKRSVPATLFLNARWIDANPDVFEQLAADPLFEIGNHGTVHRPLSVTGRSAYGIAGTGGVGEVYDEVAGNAHKLAGLLGRPVRFFRSGTAHYDDVAARGGRRPGGTRRGLHRERRRRGDAQRRRGAAGDRGGPARGDRDLPHEPPGRRYRPGVVAAVPGLLAAGRRFVRLSDVMR